jgi:hypothetical protein
MDIFIARIQIFLIFALKGRLACSIRTIYVTVCTTLNTKTL